MHRALFTVALATLIVATPPPLSAASVMEPSGLDRYLGSQQASEVMVVYSSPTCSHCVDFERQILPEIRQRYVETGKLRIVYRPFVRNAIDAVIFLIVESVDKAKRELTFTAFTSRCEQISQSTEREMLLRQISADVGIGKTQFDNAVANRALLEELDQITVRAGSEFGVEGTPAFFINGRQVLYDGTVRPFVEAMGAVAR